MTMPGRQTVVVGGVLFGGPQSVVIAGPCAVESQEQIQACARSVADAGLSVLRGGAYKPRTSCSSFQGLGSEGYHMLKQAADHYGLITISEVLSISQLDEAIEWTDILQIGSRTMQHFPLLSAIGKSGKPVLLKRGFGSTIDEWLEAVHYIEVEGNRNILLCERGIRTFETSTRFTLDLSAVPVLKALSPYPIIVDPSHASGRRDLVPALSCAALAAGADGIMLEVHPSPDTALSDGAQSLPLDDLPDLVASLARVGNAVGRPLMLSGQAHEPA
jgi:3-deoxy-7-phosphoheptulonate synthase